MEKFRDVLAIIFFLIWIPLGLLLVGGVIFIIAMNPLKMMQDMFSNSFEAMGNSVIGGMDKYGPGQGMSPNEMKDQYAPSDQYDPAGGFEEYIPSAQ